MTSTPPNDPPSGSPQPGSGEPPSSDPAQSGEQQRYTPPQPPSQQSSGYGIPQPSEQQRYTPPQPPSPPGPGAPQPGAPAYGQQAAPGVGQPEPQGYGGPPSAGPPQQYVESGYAQPGAYTAPPGYGQQPDAGQPAGYPPAPGYGQPGYPGQGGWVGPAQGSLAGQPATWLRRVGQYLIDVLVLLIPALVIYTVLGQTQQVTSGAATFTTKTLGPAGSIVLAIVIGAYFTFMVAQRGATVGMTALGMRAVREEDGGPLPLDRAAFRASIFWVPTFFNFLPVIGSLLGLAAFVAILWPLWDPRKQGLHDKLGKALIVRT